MCMKIFRNKIIFVVSLLAIALAPIICCSLMQSAFADSTSLQSVEKTNPMPCHKNSSQDQSTTSSNNCDCHKVSAFIQTQNFDILKSLSFISFLPDYLSTGNLLFAQIIKHSSQFALFDSSPPNLEGSVHLYLQNSILRI